MKHYQVRNEWRQFNERPVLKQISEEAATFIPKWYHPEKDILYSYVDMELDDIAQEVTAHIKIKNQDHPIISASKKQLLFWRYNNINKTEWNACDTKEILETLYHILLPKVLRFLDVSTDTPYYEQKSFFNIVSYTL